MKRCFMTIGAVAVLSADQAEAAVVRIEGKDMDISDQTAFKEYLKNSDYEGSVCESAEKDISDVVKSGLDDRRVVILGGEYKTGLNFANDYTRPVKFSFSDDPHTDDEEERKRIMTLLSKKEEIKKNTTARNDKNDEINKETTEFNRLEVAEVGLNDKVTYTDTALQTAQKNLKDAKESLKDAKKNLQDATDPSAAQLLVTHHERQVETETTERNNKLKEQADSKKKLKENQENRASAARLIKKLKRELKALQNQHKNLQTDETKLEEQLQTFRDEILAKKITSNDLKLEFSQPAGGNWTLSVKSDKNYLLHTLKCRVISEEDQKKHLEKLASLKCASRESDEADEDKGETAFGIFKNTKTLKLDGSFSKNHEFFSIPDMPEHQRLFLAVTQSKTAKPTKDHFNDVTKRGFPTTFAHFNSADSQILTLDEAGSEHCYSSGFFRVEDSAALNAKKLIRHHEDKLVCRDPETRDEAFRMGSKTAMLSEKEHQSALLSTAKMQLHRQTNHVEQLNQRMHMDQMDQMRMDQMDQDRTLQMVINENASLVQQMVINENASLVQDIRTEGSSDPLIKAHSVMEETRSFVESLLQAHTVLLLQAQTDLKAHTGQQLEEGHNAEEISLQEKKIHVMTELLKGNTELGKELYEHLKEDDLQKVQQQEKEDDSQKKEDDSQQYEHLEEDDEHQKEDDSQEMQQQEEKENNLQKENVNRLQQQNVALQKISSQAQQNVTGLQQLRALLPQQQQSIFEQQHGAQALQTQLNHAIQAQQQQDSVVQDLALAMQPVEIQCLAPNGDRKFCDAMEFDNHYGPMLEWTYTAGDNKSLRLTLKSAEKKVIREFDCEYTGSSYNGGDAATRQRHEETKKQMAALIEKAENGIDAQKKLAQLLKDGHVAINENLAKLAKNGEAHLDNQKAFLEAFKKSQDAQDATKKTLQNIEKNQAWFPNQGVIVIVLCVCTVILVLFMKFGNSSEGDAASSHVQAREP